MRKNAPRVNMRQHCHHGGALLNWLRSIIGPPDAAETRKDPDSAGSLRGDRLRELESDVKQLRLEWEETYESVNRALRKIAKREKRAAEESECEDCPPSVNGGVKGATNWMAVARQRYGDPWRGGR